MSRRNMACLLILFTASLIACSGAGVSSTAVPDEDSLQTRVAEDVAATMAALATISPSATPPLSPPTALPPTHTPGSTAPTAPPVPMPASEPAPESIPDTYVIEEERQIGSYILTLWRNTAADSWSFDSIATIASSTDGQILVQHDTVSGIADLTGQDITGEGNPDAVIERYTGGAHCCFSILVYDLGAALTKVLETRESNCGGRFEDLDGDSVLEFVTCDDLFAYVYCPYAASPLVQAILRYEPGQGYVAASPRFAHLYGEMIARHSQLAETAVAEEMGEWDQTTKCGVLPLVLDYLYTGQADRAWEAFGRLYPYPDALLFWAEVTESVSLSSLYVATSPSPQVSLPPYYMLQWLSHCGSEFQVVGFLTEGRQSCDPSVPRRDVYWLDMRLREIDLLGEGERLELTPAGCTTNCRLDVVRYSDNARVGSIRLDTSGDFPGAVYRVNGVESAHWRLRGDLTWEQVSP